MIRVHEHLLDNAWSSKVSKIKCVKHCDLLTLVTQPKPKYEPCEWLVSVECLTLEFVEAPNQVKCYLGV